MSLGWGTLEKYHWWYFIYLLFLASVHGFTYETSDFFYSVITCSYTKCFVHSYTVDVVFTLSYWDFYDHSLLFELYFRLSVTKQFWFCKCTTPWMFPPLDSLLQYRIEHATLRLHYVYLYSLLGYSTGELQALQLIVLAVFGAVD